MMSLDDTIEQKAKKNGCHNTILSLYVGGIFIFSICVKYLEHFESCGDSVTSTHIPLSVWAILHTWSGSDAAQRARRGDY